MVMRPNAYTKVFGLMRTAHLNAGGGNDLANDVDFLPNLVDFTVQDPRRQELDRIRSGKADYAQDGILEQVLMTMRFNGAYAQLFKPPGGAPTGLLEFELTKNLDTQGYDGQMSYLAENYILHAYPLASESGPRGNDARTIDTLRFEVLYGIKYNDNFKVWEFDKRTADVKLEYHGVNMFGSLPTL